MSSKRRKFSPEFRDEAVKMVIDTSRPIAQVARELEMECAFLKKATVHFARESQ